MAVTAGLSRNSGHPERRRPPRGCARPGGLDGRGEGGDGDRSATDRPPDRTGHRLPRRDLCRPGDGALPGGPRRAPEADVPDIRPWSTEVPQRYRLLVACGTTRARSTETTAQWIGFRSVDPERDLFLDGERVLIRGVNRHDHHPDRGKTLLRPRGHRHRRRAHEALRLERRAYYAHYPNDPTFLDLCNSTASGSSTKPTSEPRPPGGPGPRPTLTPPSSSGSCASSHQRPQPPQRHRLVAGQRVRLRHRP